MTAAEAQQVLTWTAWGLGLFIILVLSAVVVPRLFPEKPRELEPDYWPDHCGACGRIPFSKTPTCLLCKTMDEDYLSIDPHGPQRPKT